VTSTLATPEVTSPNNQVSQPNPIRFFQALHAYQQTAALKTALDLELFTAIGEAHSTVPEIAQRTKAAERGVRVLCDFLVILGFMYKNENRYSLTVDSAVFLDKNSPAYAGSAANFIVSDFLLNRFKDFTALVREGGPAPEAALRGVNDSIWVEFARHMGPLVLRVAERTEELLRTAGKVKILDIAAGHGLYGLWFARNNPNAEIYALDSEAVLKVAKENAERFGLAGRWHALPGDALGIPLGTSYDLVLVPNLLHHWDRNTIQAFLKKVHFSLVANGRVAIIEFVPNEDRVSPPIPASFAVNMLVTTPGGDAYPASEYRNMLLQAGFDDPQIHPLLPMPHTILVAGKK